MQKVKSIVSNLIQEQQKVWDKDEAYLISAYVPVESFNKKDIKTQIKSKLTKAFRNHDELKDEKKIQQRFIDSVNLAIDSIDEILQGYGVFGWVDVENDNKEKVDYIQQERLQVITLNLKPKSEVNIGSTYDLDQLLRELHLNLSAIVINVKADKADVFRFFENKFEKVVELENTHYDRQTDKDLAHFAPDERTTYNFTPGDKPHQLRDVYEKFIDDVVGEVDEKLYSDAEHEYDYLAIYFSKRIERYKDLFDKKLKKLARNKMILMDKSLQDYEDIESDFFYMIQEEYLKQKQESLSEAKETKKYFTDWKQTVKGAREKRIEELYVKPTAKKAGYIFEKMPFVIAKKDSFKVDNLVPWIVESTYETDGKVYVLDDENFEDEPDIAVKFRF
jgi:hypothetical protein